MDETLISKSVSKVFGVEEKDLTSQKRSAPLYLARSFMWYILHCEEGYTIPRLSKMYGRSMRNIYQGIANVRDRLVLQPYYANFYKDIKQEIATAF